jgi:sporulation protein YlmC with PRC-barrel domain
MPGIDVVSGWRNLAVVGADGATIGKIAEIYLDDRTDRPEWALVSSVARGGNLVPIADATQQNNAVHVPYDSARVASAPGMGSAGALSEDEEAHLYRHYGLQFAPRPIEIDL